MPKPLNVDWSAVRADEKLTAFPEPESVARLD
jgi:hypothetical protein